MEIALDHWLDKNPSFRLEDLMSAFPWIRKELAQEEISFWLAHDFIQFDGVKYTQKTKNPRESLIFLDIDGVLNHLGSKKIDDTNLLHLSKMVHRTKAKIILVSSWKQGWSKDNKDLQDDDANDLDAKLAEFGLSIYDKGSMYLGKRSLAIIDCAMRFNTTSFVILDDERRHYERTPLERYLVQTRYNEGGLNADLAEIAVNKLINLH